jgi:multidrug efflux pump subunit AcrA (membrane-fusion protein)
MAKKIILIMLTMILVIAAVLVIKNKQASIANLPVAKRYAMVVNTQLAQKSQVQLTLPYLAQVQSDSDVEIVSKLTSRVTMILPSAAKVNVGDVVVRLDASDLIAKKRGLLSQVRGTNSEIVGRQADLANAQQTHQRSAQLLKNKLISQQQFDDESSLLLSLDASVTSLKEQVNALKQSINELDSNISYATIHSPFNGIISKTYVAKGSIASAGKSLINISGKDDKFLLVRTTETLQPVALFYHGQRCDLQPLLSTFNGLDEYSCHSTINLAAGARIAAKLLIFEGEGILLPHDALLHLNGLAQVVLLAGEQAQAQDVTIIAEASEGILVSGLAPGSEYIVAKPDILLKLIGGVKVIKATSPAIIQPNKPSGQTRKQTSKKSGE